MNKSDLYEIIEGIGQGEADTTTDMHTDEYRAYLMGQADVAAWLRTKLQKLIEGEEK